MFCRNLNPSWNEWFNFRVPKLTNVVSFIVKDKDTLGAAVLPITCDRRILLSCRFR